MVKEIELKLELSPQAATAFLKSELLKAAPVVKRQQAIYFDTPDHDLHAAGLSLRVRESGGQRVQTVKAGGSSAAAGLFARPEWEFPIEADRPAVDDRTPIPAILGQKVDGLSPAFEVHTERRIWTIAGDAAEVELVFDRGEIVAGDRRAPICEIELELKAGSSERLFSLARRFDAVAPLRLGVLSKAERGYRLLGPAQRAIKAETAALTADMTAGAAFQQIARTCIRHFRLNETLLLAHRDPEALHQARVALRRLRSAFSIHKRMILDSQFDRMRDEFRTLTTELGKARNIDVLIERSQPGELRSRLEQARVHAYDAVETALASPRSRGLMLDLAEWISIGGWLKEPATHGEIREQPAREFAASALDRLRRKVKKRERDLAGLDDAGRHEVRKDAKKLRYAAEFFSLLFDGKRQKRRLKRFVGSLESLQDRLGELNDLATVSEVLAHIGLEDASTAALLSVDESKEALVEAAADAHADFVDCKRFWR